MREEGTQLAARVQKSQRRADADGRTVQSNGEKINMGYSWLTGCLPRIVIVLIKGIQQRKIFCPKFLPYIALL